MSIRLVRPGTTDEFSFGGDGSDPLTLAAQLDDSGTPPTIDSNIYSAELLATQYSYTDIEIDVGDEDTGIDIQYSLDNINWHDDIDSSPAGDLARGTIPEPDASGGDIRIPVYIKASVNNDGSVATDLYEDATIDVTATEHQTP
jgi:hypothetical protein